MTVLTGQRICSPLIVVTMVAVAILSGCGGAGDIDPNLKGVSGAIKLGGSPVTTGGTVTFVSEDGKSTYSGIIDATGIYTVNASQSGKGALPGDYKVAIQAWATAPAMAEDGTPTEGVSAIGEKYHSPETSGLTATVTDGANTIDFDLSKAE